MKILLTCGTPSWGGIEIVTLRLAIQLKTRNHEVYILCRENSILQKQSVDNFIQTIHFSGGVLSNILKLKNIFTANNFDIIHSRVPHDLWYIVPVLKLTLSKPKLILSVNIASGVNKKDLFHRFIYRRVNKVFAVSNYIKDTILNKYPFDEIKIKIIHDGVDLNEFSSAKFSKTELRKEFNLSADKKFIGMTGRMTPGKGHEEFFNAVKLLTDKREDLAFMVVGAASHGEKNYETHLMNFCEQQNIKDKIRFMGQRTDISKMLAVMDLLVFPSHEESFGDTLIEAMAIGVPIIASNKGGVPDIIIDGECGVLIEPKNPVLLAEAIENLIDDETLLKKFSQKGFERVKEKFDIKKIIEQIETEYKS